MKKGQISVEVVGLIGFVTLIYAGAVYLGVRLNEEAADRVGELDEDIRCGDLSAVVNAVYSGGSGTSTHFSVRGNYTVYPGLIEMNEKENPYYCTIHEDAVDGTWTLTTREYVIRNEGGKVGFE